MLLDTQNLFSDNQIIADNTYSTNTVKFGAGNISYLPLLIQVTADFSNTEKLKVEIETSKTEDFENTISLAALEAQADNLKAGYTFSIGHLPKGNLGYMRLKYSTTPKTTTGTSDGDNTTDTTSVLSETGAITAGVCAGVDARESCG